MTKTEYLTLLERGHIDAILYKTFQEEGKTSLEPHVFFNLLYDIWPRSLLQTIFISQEDLINFKRTLEKNVISKMNTKFQIITFLDKDGNVLKRY